MVFILESSRAFSTASTSITSPFWSMEGLGVAVLSFATGAAEGFPDVPGLAGLAGAAAGAVPS
jgi:hypothetical protein